MDQICKIWRPPFGGGPRPLAPMAPIDEKALIATILEGNSIGKPTKYHVKY